MLLMYHLTDCAVVVRTVIMLGLSRPWLGFFWEGGSGGTGHRSKPMSDIYNLHVEGTV